MVGALIIWISDWRGRRFAIFVGCVGVCIAAVIQGTSRNIGQFIAGRFLLSFLGTLPGTASPLYLVEIAPPLYRGTVAGGYNTLYYMGSIVATFCVYGTSIHMAGSNSAWQIPVFIQMICPGLVACGIWFLPESPRW
jgi:MFS family permease